MTDYTDLKRRLAQIHGGETTLTPRIFATIHQSAAAIAALEAEVAQWRVRIERIQAELIARGADSVGDEASAYNDAALALRILLDSAALADQPTKG